MKYTESRYFNRLQTVILSIILLSFAGCSNAQEKLIINSIYLPSPDTILIYQPNERSSSNSLTFLLHGWSGNYAQWSEILNLKKYAEEYKTIIVCPDGLYDCWYINSPIDSTKQFEKFFFNDLYPRLKQNLKFDSTKIFISGLSMGGFGATRLYLLHPDFFLAAGSTSGILDLKPFYKNWGMEKVLGTDSSKYFPEFSPVGILRQFDHTPFNLIVDCGTTDFAYMANFRFYQICLDKKLPLTFISRQGAHNQDYWTNSLPYHFKYFQDVINRTYIHPNK